MAAEPATAADLRLMNIPELTGLAKTSDAAAEHLGLRREAETTCRGVLVGLGYRSSGTGGWNITAFVDPENHLGFVNVAHGVALLTDVTLDPAVVEAATVPDQPEGPQVSGAAAWTSPDAGEAHHASAPDGWTQLIVDIRDRGQAPVPCTAHVVAWGLATCYDGKLGVPGHSTLAGEFCYPWRDTEGAIPPDEWPETATSKEMRRIASDALADIARDLAVTVPDAAAQMPDVETAINVVRRKARKGISAYSVAGAARFAIPLDGLMAGTAIHRLHRLTDPGDGRVRQASRSMELIRLLVEALLTERLTKVGDVLSGFVGPLMDATQRPTEAYRTLERQLRLLVTPLQDELLREVEERARDAACAAVAAYTAAGYIQVRLPLPRRGAR